MCILWRKVYLKHIYTSDLIYDKDNLLINTKFSPRKDNEVAKVLRLPRAVAAEVQYQK